MISVGFARASKKRPCRICGKPNYCLRTWNEFGQWSSVDFLNSASQIQAHDSELQIDDIETALRVEGDA